MQIKLLNLTNNKKNMRGFTLGVAMIIMGILVTISIGMSTLLLKDLKLVSVTEKSSIAYNIADSILACATSYENHIRYINPAGVDDTGIFPTSTQYTYDTNYKENYTNSNTTLNKDSIKCFDKEILDIVSSQSLDKEIKKNETFIEPATVSNSPTIYLGGVKTTVRVQTDYMKSNLRDACAEVEIYSIDSQDKLFVAKGKVPCTGPKIIEKVIVKSVQ